MLQRGLSGLRQPVAAKAFLTAPTALLPRRAALEPMRPLDAPPNKPRSSREPEAGHRLWDVLEGLRSRVLEISRRGIELVVESSAHADLARLRPVCNACCQVHRHAVDIAIVHLHHLAPM